MNQPPSHLSGQQQGNADLGSQNPPSAVLLFEYSLSGGTHEPLLAFDIKDIEETVQYLTGASAVGTQLVNCVPSRHAAGNNIQTIKPNNPLSNGFDMKRFSPIIALLPASLNEDALRVLQRQLSIVSFPDTAGSPSLRLIMTPWGRGPWEQLVAAVACTSKVPPPMQKPPQERAPSTDTGYNMPPQTMGGPARNDYYSRDPSYDRRAPPPSGPYSSHRPPPPPQHNERPRAPSQSGWGEEKHSQGPPISPPVGAPTPAARPGPLHPALENPKHQSMIRFELINMFFMEGKGFDVVDAIVGTNAVHINYILSKAQGQVDLRIKGFASDTAPLCDRLHLELKGTNPECTYAASEQVTDLLKSVRSQLIDCARVRSIQVPADIGFRDHRYVAQRSQEWGTDGSVTWKYIK